MQIITLNDAEFQPREELFEEPSDTGVHMALGVFFSGREFSQNWAYYGSGCVEACDADDEFLEDQEFVETAIERWNESLNPQEEE